MRVILSFLAAFVAVWLWHLAVGEASYLVGGAVLLLPALMIRSQRR